MLDIDPDEQPQMVESKLAQGVAGSLLFVTDPAEINRLQRLAVEGNRLASPLLFGFDVIHGLRTIFPVPIAMAASWDPETIEAGQAVAAREARAVGIHWTFAPMVDIARDPRWGRIIEGAGEDPYLGAAVAAAQVRGFQGPELGAPGAGHRRPETPRRVRLRPRRPRLRRGQPVGLRAVERRLPAVPAAVEAGAGNVMTALHGPQRHPGHRQPVAVHRGAARDAGVSTGFVVSDANAVRNLLTHGFAADLTDAGARAVNAGVDLEMAISDAAYAHLPEALDSGATDVETIDASVRRILEAKIRLGLLDDPYVDEDRAREVLADPAHRDVARVAAERSAVLLRNEGDLLPLDAAALGSVAVIGPLADSAARHHRALGLRLRPGRDGHRARRDPRPGRRRRPGRVRPRRAGGATRVPVAVRHVRPEHPVRSRGVRRGRRVPQGRRPRCAKPMSRSSWPVSGRT